MVVDWGVSLSELDGVDAECEGAFEEESSSSCCLLSLFLSRRFLDFDDCTRFPLLSDSPATDTCKFERKIATQLRSVSFNLKTNNVQIPNKITYSERYTFLLS